MASAPTPTPTPLATAVSEALAALTAAQTAVQTVQTYVSNGAAETALAAAEQDAENAVTSLGQLTAGLNTLVVSLNAIAGVEPSTTDSAGS